MNIIGHIGGFLLVANFVVMVLGWVVFFYYKIKCRKIHSCKKENCPVREHCYKHVMGPQEEKALRDMVRYYKEYEKLEKLKAKEEKRSK